MGFQRKPSKKSLQKKIFKKAYIKGTRIFYLYKKTILWAELSASPFSLFKVSNLIDVFIKVVTKLLFKLTVVLTSVNFEPKLIIDVFDTL